jgi:signal transduction histidine kinase
VNWFVAVKTIHAEKVEAVEKVLNHLLIESTDEYITIPLTPSSDVGFLYSIPHNEMILRDSEASRLRFVVSLYPNVTNPTLIASSIKLSNGYYLNALSNYERIGNAVYKYGEKLLIRYLSSLFIILLIIIFVLDYYMKPLAHLAQKTREWKRDNPFDLILDDATSEIRDVSTAFAALVRRLEGYRQKEGELFKEAAHELKTPLALMRSRLDVYESSDAYEKSKFTDDLGHDIERLSGELKNVLFLESSDFEEPTSIDVAEMLETIVHKMEILIVRKQLTLQLPERTFLIRASEKLVFKVLGALLENAITYAKEKTSIEVGCDPAAHKIWIGNSVGNEKYLFSSKIGEKMLKRLSRDIGFAYDVVQETGYYRITLRFA